MKKAMRAVIVAALTLCLLFASGCSMFTAFEKDVNVVLNVDGEYGGTYTVNIFNNAIVETPTKAGLEFKGWTLKADYEYGVDGEELLFPEKELIHFNDVKDGVVGNSATVNVYAVFGPKHVYDFVVAWYDKVATSGVTQNMITEFTAALKAELAVYNATNPEIVINIDNIAVRGYSGNVDEVGMGVNEDGDVDILVGMKKISGIETLEKVDYAFGEKTDRNIARLTDDAVAVYIFTWMQTDEVRAIFAPGE